MWIKRGLGPGPNLHRPGDVDILGRYAGINEAQVLAIGQIGLDPDRLRLKARFARRLQRRFLRAAPSSAHLYALCRQP